MHHGHTTSISDMPYTIVPRTAVLELRVLRSIPVDKHMHTCTYVYYPNPAQTPCLEASTAHGDYNQTIYKGRLWHGIAGMAWRWHCQHTSCIMATNTDQLSALKDLNICRSAERQKTTTPTKFRDRYAWQQADHPLFMGRATL